MKNLLFIIILLLIPIILFYGGLFIGVLLFAIKKEFKKYHEKDK